MKNTKAQDLYYKALYAEKALPSLYAQEEAGIISGQELADAVNRIGELWNEYHNEVEQ
jgi:hypothetical protein